MRSLQFKQFKSANLDAPESGIIISNNPLHQIVREFSMKQALQSFWIPGRAGSLLAWEAVCTQFPSSSVLASHNMSIDKSSPCVPSYVGMQHPAQGYRHGLLIRDYINPWQDGDDLLTSMGLSIWDICIFSVLLGTNCTAMLSESEMGNVL